MGPITQTDNSGNRLGAILILLVSVAALIGIFLIEPIAQSSQYHQFIDQRSYLGIPNFLNVASNAGFFLLGVWGVYLLAMKKAVNILPEIQQFYVVLLLLSYQHRTLIKH